MSINPLRVLKKAIYHANHTISTLYHGHVTCITYCTLAMQQHHIHHLNTVHVKTTDTFTLGGVAMGSVSRNASVFTRRTFSR